MLTKKASVEKSLTNIFLNFYFLGNFIAISDRIILGGNCAIVEQTEEDDFFFRKRKLDGIVIFRRVL